MNSVLQSLAAFPEEMIPIVAIVMTMAIPIVAILVHHQRKMAELFHQTHLHQMQSQAPNPEIEAMRREMGELRQLMHQQAIALDDLRNGLPAKSSESDVSARLG